MSPEMSPVPQAEEYNHAQAMQEREAALQAARLEVFPKVAEFMANPDSEFAAGPDVRKATGLSHHDITIGLGYGSFSELKQDTAAWKQEQEAKAADDAKRAENQAKEQAYQDEMNVHRQKRAEANQKVADFESGKRPMTYREKLLAGGERGVALLEKSRAMSREDAVGAAALEGYSVGHLKSEKTHVHSSPAAEARQSEHAAKLKEFDAAVLSAQGKAPKARTVESTRGTVDDTPDFLRGVAPSAGASELPFFLRDASAPRRPSRLVDNGEWRTPSRPEAASTVSAEDVADALYSGEPLTPEASDKAEQLYNLIAISPDGKEAAMLMSDGTSVPMSVEVAKRISKAAHQAREARAREAVAAAEQTILTQEQAKQMALEAVGAVKASVNAKDGLGKRVVHALRPRQEVHALGHISPEIPRPDGLEAETRAGSFDFRWAFAVLTEVKRVNGYNKKHEEGPAPEHGAVNFMPQNHANIQRLLSFANKIKSQERIQGGKEVFDENGKREFVFYTIDGSPLYDEVLLAEELSRIDTFDVSESEKEELAKDAVKEAYDHGQKIARALKVLSNKHAIANTAYKNKVPKGNPIRDWGDEPIFDPELLPKFKTPEAVEDGSSNTQAGEAAIENAVTKKSKKEKIAEALKPLVPREVRIKHKLRNERNEAINKRKKAQKERQEIE